MVWGAFSAAGTGELLHCEKSMNALEYRRILQKGLLPTIEKLFSKEEQSDVIFQQDNAPAYTAKTTKMWFENKSIRLMCLPGQSPDLNSIVNIWSQIKHKLTGKHFSTTHQLFEAINIDCKKAVHK